MFVVKIFLSLDFSSKEASFQWPMDVKDFAIAAVIIFTLVFSSFMFGCCLEYYFCKPKPHKTRKPPLSKCFVSFCICITENMY